MFLINNKLVSQTMCGKLTIDGNAYYLNDNGIYYSIFGNKEVSAKDLERIYVFTILLEDKQKKKQQIFNERLYSLLDELNIPREDV